MLSPLFLEPFAYLIQRDSPYTVTLCGKHCFSILQMSKLRFRDTE